MKIFGNVLIIGKVWPEPSSSAAGTRMMQLINLFKDAGAHVTFGCTANTTEFQEDLSNYGLSTVHLELNNSSFDDVVKALNPTVVVFDRFMTEEQFGWRVMESCPNALRVLNTEDLHFLREARRKALQDGSMNDLNFDDESCYREIASIYRSDLTLLVSTFEQELLETTFNIPKDLLHYIPVCGKKIESTLGFKEREDFVFIGNFHHKPNWDAVRFLRADIWPLIHKVLPQAKMHVYGAYTSHKVQNLQSDKFNFLVHGRANNALEVVSSARVSLAPIRFGAGMKGKLLEAMMCGTPNVTTEIGAESMCFNNQWGGLIENDFRKFADAAIELYTTERLWFEKQQIGFDIVKNHFNLDDYSAKFLEKISSGCQSLTVNRKKHFIAKVMQHQSMLSTKYMSQWIAEKNKTN